ncbi:hypothetical protein MMC24_004821 [Lignoscripta atroalba]|nr:hypothetical protein [Lignoscripta atroalba]
MDDNSSYHINQNDGCFPNESPLDEPTQTIPPPPPALPEPRFVQSIPPPPPLPPNAFGATRSLTHSENKSLVESNAKYMVEQLASQFQPCFFFFYGTLMDTDVLQAVLGLSEAPVVRKGLVIGFSMKMWGIYPTLIPYKGEKISGTVWKVNELSQFLRLQEYETSAYACCTCDIELDDGEVIHDGRTFCWAGDSSSRDLEEGTFDLERYQRYFKSSVVRKC